MILSLILFGCNNVKVYEGTIISKTMGEPLLFSFGQLKMINPRDKATPFCFTVQAENGDIAEIYVTQEIYEKYAVGDWYDITG